MTRLRRAQRCPGQTFVRAFHRCGARLVGCQMQDQACVGSGLWSCSSRGARMYSEAVMKFLGRNPLQGLTWFLLAFALFPHTLSSALEAGSEAGQEHSPADSAELLETHEARERMVQEQMVGRGIRDRRVLDALRRVHRHRFVPPEMQVYAYEDTPLPIGLGQTISQ